ncbi:hypothetical protein D083_0405 [Dickeya solani RNS 08.23.3.1.A]|nr:hypothetical protein D083_0405 [Dickeya solani RNS 08.23.3.1.A]
MMIPAREGRDRFYTLVFIPKRIISVGNKVSNITLSLKMNNFGDKAVTS